MPGPLAGCLPRAACEAHLSRVDFFSSDSSQLGIRMNAVQICF